MATDTSMPSSGQICSFLENCAKPVNIEVLAHGLDCAKVKKKDLKKLLEQLAAEGKVQKLPHGQWLAANRLPTIGGTIFMTRNGGRFVPATGDEELAVSPSCMGEAWDRDTVRVIPFGPEEEKRAKVISIVKRNQPEVAARVARKAGRNIILRSTGKKVPVFFTLHCEKNSPLCKKLKHGQLVTVRPEKPLPDGNWQAKLLNVYTKENTLSLQEALVKLNHNVPEAFPALALRQAEALPEKPDPADFAGRRDLRAMPFITIDGEDARDFDDAIYVEKAGDGWLLRVAIADVSHYVLPDANPDSLDGEAKTRGNSWYFPKSVEPMLPKKLSNGLCSLKPGEERLAMVAEIPVSRDGVCGKPDFYAAVIKSAARLTYTRAADYFSGNVDALTPALAPMLEQSLALYRKLALQRRKRGTLDFELPEPDYHFNEEGELQNITIAERNDAHMLIEEFMIAANEAVATWLGKRNIPFLYRVHPVPEAIKLNILFETLKKTALEILPPDLEAQDLADPQVLQKILASAKGTPHEYVVNRLCLRSMSQARYQPVNVGHYALASPSYCHFTSPIRRYADLLVHRALKKALNPASAAVLPDLEQLAETGDALNKLERSALDCERDMARRLACLLLSGREGEELSGVISGVTEFGVFVEFDKIPAEGLIKTADLGTDWFELDPERQMLIGRSTGKIFRLGQPLKVRVAGINQDRMETRLALVEEQNPARTKKHGKTFSRPGKLGKEGSRNGQKKGFRPLQKKDKTQKKRFHD